MFTAHIDLTVSQNRLQLIDRKSGRSVVRSAIYQFSTSNALIANRECFEQEYREAFESLMPGRRLFQYPVVHVAISGGAITPVEREALIRALLDGGSSKVLFAGEP